MDVRAIILLNAGTDQPTGMLTHIPIATLDVLGRPVLYRIVDRLNRFGISAVTIIGGESLQTTRAKSATMPRSLVCKPDDGNSPWKMAQRVFTDSVQSGADIVIVMRLGPYIELDFDELIQCHLDRGNRVTAVVNQSGLLDVFAIGTTRRNDAAYLLRHGMKQLRSECHMYTFTGYVNPLTRAADLRRLAVDGFSGNADIKPEGTEVKPGIWVGPGARIHSDARILAPAFVGDHAKVRASAIITRCSVVERHSQVDCGTIVEDSTILPYSYVGAGLDLVHSVAGFRRVVHLRRNVEAEVTDPRLLDNISPAPLRTLRSVVSLASFVPLQFVRGLFGFSRREKSSTVQSGLGLAAPGLSAASEIEQLSGHFAVVRRYGNQ